MLKKHAGRMRSIARLTRYVLASVKGVVHVHSIGTSTARAIVSALIVTLGFDFVMPAASAQTPGVFSKISPTNGATGVSTSPTLSWGASSNATSYEYCVSFTGSCGSWTSAGTALSVVVSGLGANTPFSWQVRANNTNGTTYADGGSTALWTFTTLARPGSFNKSSPADFASGQPTSLTLSWTASSNAASYEYCYDTTNDGACSAWTSTGTALSADLTGLSTNTTYHWQVRANNGSGTTYADGMSTAFRHFTTVSPPGAFTKTAPTNGATGQPTNPTLSWGASTAATGYEYCIDTTNDDACSAWTSTGTTLSAGLTGLSTNTTYYWQVRANNVAGTTYADGMSTAFRHFTTVSPPVAFTKTGPADGATERPTSLLLSWGASTAATGYEYCIDTTNDGVCSAWTSTGTALSVLLTGLSTNTTYYWQVRANNAGGTTYADGSSSEFWTFTTVSPPGAFTKSSPANGATGVPTSATLTWTAGAGATSYEYCYDTSNDDACSGWTGTGMSTSAFVGSLSAGTLYYWHVRATGAGGTTYSNGSSSAFWTFTTASPPGPFTKIGPVNGATGVPVSPTLSWSASSNATSYEYCVSVLFNGVPGGCSSWTSAGVALSVVTGLSPGVPFSWQARAKTANLTTYADGSSTAWWTFITLPLPGSEGQPPAVVTLPASSVGTTSATLNATVNPNGGSTAAWFDYGLTTSYGSQITAFPGGTSIDPMSGASLVSVSATITALNCDTPYHFRIVATNTSSTNGSDVTFATAPCTGLAGAVQALAVDPTNGQVVYAGTTTGIYRTANGGASWTRVWSGGQDIGGGYIYTNVLALAIRPAAPCTIAAGIDTDVNNTFNMIVNSTGILAFSNDCGATWGSELATPSGRFARSLAFSNSSQQVLYASIVVNGKSCSPGICTDTLKGTTARIESSSSNQLFDDSVFGIVATDPANPCTTYYGRSDTFDSGSVYQSTSCTGLNWTKIGATLNGIVSAVAAHPTNQSTLMSGTLNGLIYRKLDAVSPWVSVATVSGSIASIVYTPGNPLVAYAAGSGGVVYKTIDGGATWNTMATIGSGVSSLAVGTTFPASLYVGGNSFVININIDTGLPLKRNRGQVTSQ